MAKQIGDMKFIETIDGICFYQMGGQHYAREKSSLTGKRFWSDKSFEGSRQSVARLSEASKIASRIYNRIEKGKKHYVLYCAMRKMAISLLKQRSDVQNIEGALEIIWGRVKRRKLKRCKNDIQNEERKKLIKASQFQGEPAVAYLHDKYDIGYYKGIIITLRETKNHIRYG